MAEEKRFTRKELEARNSSRDAVFVIHNAVYDVTQFLDEHPGGHEVLLDAAGRDASEQFDDVGHSLDAKDLMRKYKIGEVVDEERRDVPKREVSWEAGDAPSDAGFLGSWKFPVLLGVLVTLLYTYFTG